MMEYFWNPWSDCDDTSYATYFPYRTGALSPGSSTHGGGCRLHIVDEDPDELDELVRYFTQAGYCVSGSHRWRRGAAAMEHEIASETVICSAEAVASHELRRFKAWLDQRSQISVIVLFDESRSKVLEPWWQHGICFTPLKRSSPLEKIDAMVIEAFEPLVGFASSQSWVERKARVY
jgi:DNA-binding NtrC family response regulator